MNTPALSQSPGFPAAVHTAPPEVSVYDAARIMHWRKVGVVVVVRHHRPVGIVTDRDIVRGQVALGKDLGSLTVREVMTGDPIAALETSGIGETVERMRLGRVRRAPVVNERGDLVGIVSLAMLTTHGAAWLSLKAEGPVAARARAIGSVTGLVAILGYALAGLWLARGIEGYHLVGAVAANGPSNPFLTEAARGGSWMAAYAERPWIAVAPVLGFAGLALAVIGLRRGAEVSTLLWSKLGILGVISSVGLTMFPFLLPSITDPKSSLTVWNASSSHMTLFIMLVATVIFMPLILLYTAWVYKVLWGKVTEADVAEQSQSLY